MSRAGDVNDNPITGKRAVVRVRTEDSGGDLLVCDVYVRPSGRVAAKHVHPTIEEWLTVVSGRVGLRLDGRETVAQLGQRLHVPAGMAHDWWNAGEDEAHIVVEITPAARFEEAISTTWGLSLDGKTNARGMPNLLQLALLAREFDDVLYFTKPPRVLQRIFFGILAPVARLLGYKGSYPEYLRRGPTERVEVEPWPSPVRELA